MGWVADFTDNFNRADGNVANSWTGSFDATFQIASNQLNTLGGTFASVKAMSPAPSKGKQKAQCKVTLQGTTGSSLLCIRQQAGSISQYAVGVGGGILYIFKMSAGSTSVLNNSADLGLASGGSYILTIQADGTAISATIAAEATPNTLIATVNTTDGSFATGLQGLAGNVVNSKIDDFASYEWVDIFELTCAPEAVRAGRRATITVTCDDASWLSAAPDFELSAGTIISSTVLTNTTATIVFTPPAVTATVTVTDNTAPAEGTVEVYADLVVLEGNSQAVGPVAAPFEAALTAGVDFESIATTSQTMDDYISQVVTQLRPLVQDRVGNVVYVIFDATNSYGLDEKTGAEVYALHASLATAVRAEEHEGLTIKILATTVPHRAFAGGGGFDPDPVDINDRIDAGNALVLADASNASDRVARVRELLGDTIETWSNDDIHINIAPYPTQVGELLARGANALLAGATAGFIGGGYGGPNSYIGD